MALKLPKHFGTVEVVCFDLKKRGVREFWMLMDELEMALKIHKTTGAMTGFYCNRQHILEAALNGTLYGMCVNENSEMLKRRDAENPIFMRDRGCVNPDNFLPCFALVNEDRSMVEMLWTAERARHKGLATFLLTKLKVTKAWNILKGSEGFWEKVCTRLGIEVN